MSLLAKNAYFWRSALRGFRRRPSAHAIAVAAIAVALFLAGLARGVMQLADALLAVARDELVLTVYLREQTTEAQALEIARSLGGASGGSAQVVPPETAMERLRKELAELGDVLSDLPKNPLPLTIEVRAPNPERSVEKMRNIAAQARALPLVSAVDFGEEAMETLAAIASAVRHAAWVAFVVAAIATVVMVATTLQLAIYSRRSEIEIQRLVGATEHFVRAPFLIEGLIQGLTGSLLALVGLKLFSWIIGPRLVSLFAFLAHPGSRFALPTASLSLELAMAGGVLGLCGSFAAVRRLSRA